MEVEAPLRKRGIIGVPAEAGRVAGSKDASAVMLVFHSWRAASTVIAIAKDRRLRALEVEHSKLKQLLANAKLANAASSKDYA